jgi:transposase
LLSDDQWALIEDLLPVRTGERGGPFSDARAVAEGIIADATGLVDWSMSVDSMIVRAHQHATNITRLTGGWVELRGSAHRAA